MKKQWVAPLVAVVALLLLGGIPAMASPSAAPAPDEVRVSQADNGRQVELSGSQVLVVSLECNPSTGYSWAVQEMDTAVLRQVGDWEWMPSTDLLGAPGTQILRFAGVREGQTTLHLAYARPWEKGVAPLQTFTLQVRVRQPAPLPEQPKPANPAKPLISSGGGTTALPSSFNWCAQGKCTPIRDQGNCGSCWAFGTVGPFESALLIHDNTSRDLSEQYLVSCNTDGWGCNGGWFAHDYHEWKIPPGEPAAGAVYENDFRYQASDVPCNPPHPHHERIADWAYVGNSSSVPSVSAIKNAIYNYGPVAAAVCVDSRFQAYSGGIFTDPVPCRKVNHAIVLVGWNDADGGYWILRNSWGTSWGEQGYMRIAYGTSQVGYAANYVVYGSGGGGTMHVSAIDMSYTKKGGNVTVYTTVTIVDSANQPVSGATVYLRMTLPDGSTASGSGATGSNGQVTFSIKTRLTGTYVSEVTNVTHPTLTYDPSANAETRDSIVVP